LLDLGQIGSKTYLSLTETLDSETTGSVGQVNLLTDLDIILERDILDLNIVVSPLVEKLTGAIGSGQNVSGQIQSNHARLIELNFEKIVEIKQEKGIVDPSKVKCGYIKV
jgi:hypothetical protein